VKIFYRLAQNQPLVSDFIFLCLSGYFFFAPQLPLFFHFSKSDKPAADMINLHVKKGMLGRGSD
jgi:hypothetical protein